MACRPSVLSVRQGYVANRSGTGGGFSASLGGVMISSRASVAGPSEIV